MGMYDSIDRLVNLCDEVIESDPPGLRQKVVARYMTAFGEIIERETGTRVKADVSPGMIDITSIETIRDLLLAHRDRMEYDYMMAKATRSRRGRPPPSRRPSRSTSTRRSSRFRAARACRPRTSPP